MTLRLERIERHPIKSHGRESLPAVTMTAGQPMPFDRLWAVAHEAARLPDGGGWAPCPNFSIGSKAPGLMGINAALDEAARCVTLTHPDRPALAFRPDDPGQHPAFLDWVRPLCPPDRAQPAHVVTLPGRGYTDTDYPSVSILNLASNAALSAVIGTDLSPRRWRCNLWLSGGTAWEEDGWIGKALTIGAVTLEIVEPIIRCKATTANPETGVIDADTLTALRATRGEQWMGVYARVIEGGALATGDLARLT
ncbi:MAG: hypothetical protein RLZZ528_2835 [Pseudomonadota bacterium]|jgi:uncharacterized protein YcbX